jgi:hypothetical protein
MVIRRYQRIIRRYQRVISNKVVIRMYQIGNQKVPKELSKGIKGVIRRHQRCQ